MTRAGSRASERNLPRLTVARASAEERKAVSDRARCAVVDAESVSALARDRAGELRPERTAALHRAIAARDRAADDRTLAASRLDEARARQESIRAGSEWAAQAGEEVAAADADVAAAEAAVEACQADQRRALADLDRVLEQRAAANAAMSDAEEQLDDLGVSELDESGLRRQLEASGHAVREAQEAHGRAVARLQAAKMDLAAASDELAAAEAALARQPVEEVDTSGIDRVASALDRWMGAAADAGPDPTATALADAWNDLQTDLASVAVGEPMPEPAEIAAAAARVEEARQHLAILEAAGGTGGLSESARAEIDEAHQAVLELEERSTRRFGAGAARRELDRARAHEAELLARHGFASYIDVVLTGGRPRKEAPELLEAARVLRAAVAERDALLAAATASPELTYLHRERSRLHQHCVDLLGVEPGDHVVALLWEHPAVPAEVVQDLRAALQSVGVEPVGVSLVSAATGWLDQHRPSAEEAARREEAHRSLVAQVETLRTERARLVEAVTEAERAVADASTQLDRSSRSVSAMESELSLRADEDARRLKRFAAAEQLRAQIESLTRTLETAEEDARHSLEAAATAMADAEADLDRASGRLADLQRRARSLLAELPSERRPEGEPVDVLPELADALLAAAAELEPEITELSEQLSVAEAHVDEAMASVLAAEEELDGPRPEDHVDALRAVLESDDRVLVLDEPLAGGAMAAEALCDLLTSPQTRPVVLLTEDPTLLGWAIELPAELGRIVPIHALNLGPDPADEETMERAILELSEQGPSDSVEDPTPPVARWAGRR